MTIFYIIFATTLWYFLGCLTFIGCLGMDEYSDCSEYSREWTKKSEVAIIVFWPLFVGAIIFCLCIERVQKIHTQFTENLKKFLDSVLKFGGKK